MDRQQSSSADLPAVSAPSEWKLNRFQLKRKLGEGGMGIVYEAYDRELQTNVALKTFHRFDPGHLFRLKQEFRALAGLKNANLVTLYELILADDTCYIAMELIEGGQSFLEYVRPIDHDKAAELLLKTTARGSSTRNPSRIRSRDQATVTANSVHTATGAEQNTAQTGSLVTMGTMVGAPQEAAREPMAIWSDVLEAQREDLLATTLDYDRLRRALVQLCQGVHALHDMGKLHRDLKPSNVLVDADGRVVICDFGLVTEIKERRDSVGEGRLVGTVAYMSPEQALNERLTLASDWFTVGVMLYEALTTRRPFGYRLTQVRRAHKAGKLVAPSELDPDVPADLDELCLDLLAIDPARRPSGAEILARLGNTTSGVRVRSPGLGRERPLVGRTTQLKALWEAYDATRKGDTVVQFVRGDSGMGKSALASRFLDTLPNMVAEEVVVLSSRCYAAESVPYNAIDSLVDALSGYLKELSDAAVEQLLPPGVVELARLFPVLQRVDTVSALALKGASRVNEQEQRRQAFAALTEVFRRIAADRSLVLCVDNFQHCDMDSATLLVHILGATDAPPLLFVACVHHQARSTAWLTRQLARREQQAGGSAGIDVRELTVSPLSVPQSRALARVLLDGDDSFDIVDRTVKEAGGNPLYLEELVAAWSRRRAETASMSELERQSSLKAYAESLTIEGVVLERTHTLNDEARTLLRTAAVAGRPIPQEVIYRASALGDRNRQAVTMLRTEKLVRVDGLRQTDRIEIAHDRLKTAVLATIQPTLLATMHRRLANALVESRSVDYEAIAEHWAGAQEPERARAAAVMAADHAAHALAFDRATRLYRMALELGGGGSGQEDREIRARLADALANSGRGLEAAAAFLALARGGNAAEATEYRRRAAEQYFHSGHVDEGLTVLHEALEQFGMRMPRTDGRAFAALVWLRFRLFLRNYRFRLHDESEVADVEHKRSDLCASALLMLGMVNGVQAAQIQARDFLRLLDVGEPKHLARGFGLEVAYMGARGAHGTSRERRASELAGEMAKKSGDPGAVAFVKGASALGSYHSLELDRALSLSNGAIELLETTAVAGNLERNMVRLVNLWSLYYLGEVEEFVQRVPDLLRDAETRGDWFMFANLSAGIPNASWLFADDLEGARRLASDAVSVWPTGSGRHIQGYWEAFAEAQADLYTGEKGLAWKKLEGAWPRFSQGTYMRIRLVRAEAWQLRGRCAIDAAAAGTREQIRMLKEARRAVSALNKQRTPASTAWAQMIKAGVRMIEDRRYDAIELLEQAESAFSELGMRLYAAAARWRRGDLHRDAAGRKLVDEAKEWMHSRRLASPQSVLSCLAPGFRGLR